MTFHSVLASPTPISQEPFWTTVEQQSKGAKGKITSWIYKLVLLKQELLLPPHSNLHKPFTTWHRRGVW